MKSGDPANKTDNIKFSLTYKFANTKSEATELHNCDHEAAISCAVSMIFQA